MRNTIAGLALAIAISTPAFAAQPAFTVEQAHAAVDTIVKLVEKDYVFPEKRAAIAGRLRASETAGRYDLSDPTLFADAVQADMFAASGDRHMWLKFNPEQAEALKGQPQSDSPTDYDREVAARNNQGYRELRILPGNLRYLDMAGFPWNGAVTAQAAADAARYLSGGDAIIIDLRHNPGGDQYAVRQLVSYFFPPKDRLLMTFHDSLQNRTYTTSVLTNLDGPRLTGKPLYVLISNFTGSAAEEFAYHVKEFKLGTLVGETTAGAGNNDTLFPVDPGFVLSVSTGRPVHPVSGTNWQGVGVPPDISVPADSAFGEAELRALQLLAAKGSQAHRDEYAWATTRADSDAHPWHPDAAALAAYAGQYGKRKLWVENGTLKVQREGDQVFDLVPLVPDTFAYPGLDQIHYRFLRENGRISGFDITTDDGQHVHNDRVL